MAAEMAWKSPVKCRLMSSAGTTIERPPPVAPPLAPKVGPSDGSRSATATRRPIFASPWVRPIEIVVLPSPALVGVIAETSTSRPSGRPDAARASSFTFALSWP